MERHKSNVYTPIEIESADFDDNPKLMSSEKCTNERDLEIEVLDIDQFGILPDTEEVNNENCSNSVNEQLSNDLGEKVFCSPTKSDGGTSSTSKTSDKVFGKIQVRNYKCNHCGLATRNSREYLYHLRDDHDEEFNIHECKNCQYASKHIKNLERHCSVIHAEKIERKSESSKTSSKFSSRVPKKTKFKSSGKFQCNLCSFNTTSKRILSVHVTCHSQTAKEENMDIGEVDDKEYSTECNEIGIEDQSDFKRTDERLALTDDLTSHTQKTLKCPLCKMNIRYISWLIRHLRNNHRENVRAETLAAAYEKKKRKKRPNYAGLEIHESNKILENGTKLRISSSASKSGQMRLEDFGLFSPFSSQTMSDNNKISDGKSHIDHTVRCSICYQKFKGKLELKEHMQAHSTSPISDFDLKSYKGKSCDISDNVGIAHNASIFPKALKSPILRKVRNALGSKISNLKYKCPYCPFSIRSVSRFHVHFIQHMKNLQFRCSDCDYHSSWKWTVVKHIWSKVRNERNHFNASVLTNNELVDLNSFKLYKKYLVNYQLNTPQLNSIQRNCNTLFQSAKSFSSNISSVNGSNVVDSSFENATIPNVLSYNVPDSSKEINYYYCKECSFKSVSKQIVINHLASHAGIKPFQCSVCDFKSNWKFAIIRHMKTLHIGHNDVIAQKINFTQEGFILCRKSNFESSDKGFENPESVIQHAFHCRICPYSTNKKYHMNFHKKQHRRREGANHKCDKCPYFVKFAKTLIKHKKLHNTFAKNLNAIGHLQVNSCIKEFRSSGSVEKLPNKLFRKMSLACSKCPARFSQNDRFNRHLELHGKNYRYKCDICDYSVPVAVNLMKHKRLHEMKMNEELPDCSQQLKSFVCPVCPASFNLRHRYVRHLKFHNRNYNNQSGSFDERNTNIIKPKKLQYIKKKYVRSFSKSFRCPKCPTLFANQERYERHLELHGKNLRFTCSYCDFSVQNAVNIKKHELIHNRNSEPQDPVYSENLNEAIEIAQEPVVEEPLTLANLNEKKLFICDRCPYYSGSRSAVQNHQRSHWLKQGYECPHCDYSSMQRGSLQSHLKLHLEGSKLFPPEAFMKFQSFKIVVQEENGEKLVFDDETMVNDKKGKLETQTDASIIEGTVKNIQNNSVKSCQLKEINENHTNDADTNPDSASQLKPTKKKPIIVLTDIFDKKTLD